MPMLEFGNAGHDADLSEPDLGNGGGVSQSSEHHYLELANETNYSVNIRREGEYIHAEDKTRR